MRKTVTRLAIAATLAMLIVAPWGATRAQPPFPIPGLGGPPPMLGGPLSEGSCPTIDILRWQLMRHFHKSDNGCIREDRLVRPELAAGRRAPLGGLWKKQSGSEGETPRFGFY